MPSGSGRRWVDGEEAAAPNLDESGIGRIFRAESGRSVATLIRIFGDIDLAEDAAEEAFAVALRKWPVDGLPPNPGGWITMTARTRAIDRLRREARERVLLGEVAALAVWSEEPDTPEEVEPVQDDRCASCLPVVTLPSRRKHRWRSRFAYSAA